ncbi:hypothetical protein [Marinicella sp. W31]|uniref:TonB-dependent receptor n=1 Tax=Marinicella sp. W31 TaxID=3023713 RepID=UPI003757064C
MMRFLLGSVLLLSVSGACARTLTQVIQQISKNGVQIVYSSEFINTDLIDVFDPINTLQELTIFLESRNFELVEVRDEIFFISSTAQKENIQTGAVVVGDVKDRLTGLSIADVVVILDQEEKTTISVTQSGFSFFVAQPGNHVLEVKHPDYTSARVSLNLEAGQVLVEDITLLPKPQALENISVTASLYDFTNQEVVNHSVLFQEELQRLPLLADDPIRAVEKLPGFTSTGVGARPFVRGGKQNETQIILNGLPLRRAYHYRDYLSVQSILNLGYVNDLSTYAGVFPVQYGNAISGVMEINSLRPHQSFFADATAAKYNNHLTFGGLVGERGSYLASLRQGGRILDGVGGVDEARSPNFEDAFLNFNHDFGNNWIFDANFLHSNDEVLFVIADIGGFVNADYNDNNLWFSATKNFEQGHQLVNRIALQNTKVIRVGFNSETTSTGLLQEVSDTDFFTFETQYKHQVSDRLIFNTGASLQRHKADDVLLVLFSMVFDPFFLQLNPGNPGGIQAFELVSANETANSLYANIRYRWTDQIVSDIGIRYDNQNWIEKSQLSPRVNLSYFPNKQTAMKLGLGRHFQTQAIDEVVLEDGVAGYFLPESADIALFEWSRLIGSDYVVRTEFYSKKYRQVHPYYENLFSKLTLQPELLSDRVRVAPTGARSKGIDVSLSRKTDTFDWFVAYSYSDVNDIINGQEVPRSWNQKNAIKADFSWRYNNFEISTLLNYHTGWPITEIFQDTGFATIGERNAEDLSDFLNLNLKLSYTTRFYRTDIKYWAQVSNLLERDNACCFSYQFALNEQQGFDFTLEEEAWQPRLFNFGVSVYFE